MAETFVVVAGAEGQAKVFTVHTSYAVRSSKFIKAALSRDCWKEAQEKRITLDHIEPETFEGYLNWLYSGKITPKDPTHVCKYCLDDTPSQAMGHICTTFFSIDVAKMWILGDYLNDLRFCNASVDALYFAFCGSLWLSAPAAVKVIWEQTTPECPVRSCFLERLQGATVTEDFGPIAQSQLEYSREFLIDLLGFVGRRYREDIVQDIVNNEKPFAPSRKFHKHVDDDDKCT